MSICFSAPRSITSRARGKKKQNSFSAKRKLEVKPSADPIMSLKLGCIGMLVVCVLLLLARGIVAQSPERRHKPGAPLMPKAPVIKPFSLSSACREEMKTLCDLRSPFGEQAERCLDNHMLQLSETCGVWHKARMACKLQIAAASFTECEACARFCTKDVSLMHCIRAAGSRLPALGVTAECTDSDFFRSVTRAYRKVHQAS